MYLILSFIVTCAMTVSFPAVINADDTGFKQANTSDNLKSLCERLQSAIIKKDVSQINALAGGLIPDAARLKKALRDDVAAGDLNAIQEMHDKFTKSAGGNMAKLFTNKPDQTKVNVYRASTEELAANEKDSVAWKHFPGGAVKMAQKVLKPGMTFYAAEFVKPGETAGMKYHLFYWDGSRWAMLGPVWRVIK